MERWQKHYGAVGSIGVSRKTIHKWIEREASGYGSPTWRGDDFREAVGNVELGIDAKPVSGL